MSEFTIVLFLHQLYIFVILAAFVVRYPYGEQLQTVS